MQIDLKGQTAIVTGSTAGIGFAIALGLAKAGASLILNGRSQATVTAAVAKLNELVPGADARGVAADVSTAEGAAALLEAMPQADILVNNAGIFEPKDFFETPDEDWTRMFEVNVLSGVRLSRAYLKGMLERNQGRVIFISSESGLNIPVEMIHYGFSKTAQLAVSRGLAKLTRGSKVTVNAVLPGPTLSEGVEAMLKEQVAKTGKPIEEVGADFVRAFRPTSLIQRTATVEEVANMVVYTCSPFASATNGAALRVDGGVVDFIA
ncbi:SDR family NAD(P)-dependent oxidoreductase [Nitrospirillum pindoramense]|uniref:NAD(P)-dependent dehydrogenase (Short-subunit alcohol dehydrogenase family) n=1 Tax=Nitrospirillum amazonense TaxID=28077 RepID=A0A560GVI7_9PROT|nr:SDR family oxidoreductase [Nitrospirillum amazonense]TWB37609.1 NAD(P)-dependent dehydrogenase (short-subunit alcohol dehydrogenase family) [Nitrospirillum amazonense]